MRRSKGWLSLGLCLLALSIVAGCAHEKAFKKANQLMLRHDYDQAEQALQEAIDLAERDHQGKKAKKYRVKLDQLRQEAGEYYVSRAQEDVARADLSSARQQIEHALRFQPSAANALDLKDQILAAIQRAEQHYQAAMTQANQKHWDEALSALQQVTREYSTMPGLSADIQQVKQRAYDEHVMQAKTALDADDWDRTESELRQALTYVSQGQEARQLIQTVKNRREARRLIELARRQLSAGNPTEALKSLQQAETLHHSAPDLIELMSQAKQGVCDLCLSQAQAALDRQDRIGALPLLQQSQTLLPGYGQVEQRIATVRAALSRQHQEQGAGLLQQGLAGAALFQTLAAMDYDNSAPKLRPQLQTAMQAVQESIQYAISLNGIRAEDEYTTAANLLYSTILVQLNQLRPPCVHIQEGVEETADAIIVADILGLQVQEESAVTGHGHTTYQDGMRPEANPDYLAAQQEAEKALHILNKAREQLAEAKRRRALYAHPDPDDEQAVRRARAAELDVDDAQERTVTAATHLAMISAKVATTPKDIMVPNRVQFEYPIQTVTKSAQITCLVTMTETQSHGVLLAEQVGAQYSQSDQFVQPMPRRNVPGDPLELPDDAHCREQVVKALGKNLNKVLISAVNQNRERFSLGFNQAMTTGDQEVALDQAIKYLFTQPADKEQARKMTQYLHTTLGQEDTLIDITKQLHDRGHVL